MEDLHLSDTLQRYFSDIFLCCVEENNSGMASLTKTIELIKSGNVPEDIISQIGDICWNQCTNNLLTKKQFFSALKLIAAYQSNIKISNELIKCTLDLTLPRFTIWNEQQTKQQQQQEEEEEVVVKTNDNERIVNDLIELHTNLNDYIEQIDTTTTTTTTSSTDDSEIDSDTLSINNIIINKNDSPEISSTASDSPTPTNSVQDRNWTRVTNTTTWHGLISEEQRQLLGTEEESSDKHSSEDDDTEINNEIWIINREQREYYTNQFRQLQPDLNKLIAGSVARTFFEKSRLPVNELRKIWQLADVTKDGALDLNEFNTAMHLVVLRRNHIELPDLLPSTLIPGGGGNVMVLASPTNNSEDLSPESEVITTSTNASTSSSPTLVITTTISNLILNNSVVSTINKVDNNNKEWTKFVDSPTNSSISSPGPKPVNFDFQKIILDKDSKILHPVPLRLTPECINQQQELLLEQLDSIEQHNNSPKKILATINDQTITTANLLLNSAAIIQRPQVKKINFPSGPGALPPPPSLASTTGTTTTTTTTTVSSSNVVDESGGGPVSLPAFPPPKKEKPPPPPPRPFKTHGRSSSLDLNRLNNKYGVPPIIPPRVSPNMQIWKKIVNQKTTNATITDSNGSDNNKLINKQQISNHNSKEEQREFANFDKQFIQQQQDVVELEGGEVGEEEKYENVSNTNNNSDQEIIIMNDEEMTNNTKTNSNDSLRVVIDDDDIDGIFPGDVYEAERKKIFSKFLQIDLATTTTTTTTAPRKHGAFEIYRKPNKNIIIPILNLDDKAKWEFFYKLQKENTVLLRICQELSQDLADVKEERIAVKVELEKQKMLKES